MGGHVEPLMHTSALLVRGRSLDTVTQAQSITVFPHVRADLIRTTRGLHMAELVERFSEEHEPNQPLFAHLLEGLTRLETGEHAELRGASVRDRGPRLWRATARCLDRCVSCGSPFDDGERLSFGAGWGGVLCAHCASAAAQDRVGLRPLSRPAFAGLSAIQRRGYFADPSTWASPPGVADEIERLLRWYIQSVLERPLEAAGFLDELRKAK